MQTLKSANYLKIQQGFSLLEVVLLIIIMGVLSAIAVPKFFTLSGYQNRAFFDDTVSAIRYAQKLAVATGCVVQVTINSNGYSLSRPIDEHQCGSTHAQFSRAIMRPGSQMLYASTEPDLILSPLIRFSFDALGRASDNVTLSLNQSQTIHIVKETGFVYGH